MTTYTGESTDYERCIVDMTGLHILPFICVALLWGSTDVLIAKASVQSKDEFKPTDFSPFSLLRLIWAKKIWIWMAINQLGSVLYAYLLGIYPEEYSLIWANSLTVLVAFVLDKLMSKINVKNEEMKGKEKNDQKGQVKFEKEQDVKTWLNRKQLQNWVGIGLILSGIYLMLI